MNEQIKINWYRCKVDKKVMSELMKTSDARGFRQVFLQMGLFCTTFTLAYLAFLQVNAANWMWSVPVLLLAVFVHGTFTSFMGKTAAPVHELCHKTPFKTKWLNEFFLRLYSFIGWSDYIWFRPSHVKHHQATVHEDHDGEVVLPQRLDWQSVKFFATNLTCNPHYIYCTVCEWARSARGSEADWKAKNEWTNKVLPESNAAVRREHRNWARFVLSGHIALAALFIATGHWFFIVLFTFGTFYAGWLNTLCWIPQHIGLSPNVPDFRLCCRTYTVGWLPAFLYWNMQYHVEHHMFPAVPFYNLPKLRKAIEHDLPPAPHGFWATWKEILPILQRQKEDPTYVYVPRIPQNSGDRVGDNVLELEAAQAA
jgi:fatty acid desaturase